MDIDGSGARAEVFLDPESGKASVKITRPFELNEDGWDRLHNEIKTMMEKESDESRT